MVRDSDEQLRAMNGVDRPAVARMQTGEVVFFPSEIEFTQEMKQYFMDRLTALRRGS